MSARPEPCGDEKFKIHLETGAIPCRVSRCRNIPYQYMAKLKEEFDKLENDGVISKVTKPTEWVNPIIIALKKNSDDIRLCVDFQHLNKFCKREFTSPRLLESVQLIQADEAHFFSLFDAKKGYH